MPANTTDKYSWNDAPPAGQPMQGKEKFPGPLYPPGAAPTYTPSKKTPFAKAVKRAMAHIGAWPWDPDSWDDAWSDAAAYGVEGNVNKAGMKAVQAWSGTIQPTGNVGEKTYNFLRSVRIPQGRTHAGEPAWDSVCQSLTQQALDAQLPPTPPPAQKTLRQKAYEVAVTQLGTKESPPNSNQVKYTSWYGMVGPWCAMFCTWAYETQGDSPSFVKGSRYAYVPYIVDDARGGRNGLSVTSDPLPGDVVAYNWGGSTSADAYYYDHVGLFESWQDGRTVFGAIEGNTSTSNNSNGGEVMRRSRNINSQGTVFIRVREP